jgi:thiol-disulfide isomerase/thioredoxin
MCNISILAYHSLVLHFKNDDMPLKLLIPIFLMMNLSSGCSRYPVSGNIKMGDSDKHPMLYLIEPLSFNALVSSFEGKVIDSTIIDQSGNFHFEKMPPSSEKKMYLLTIQKKGEKYPNRLEVEDLDKSNFIPFVYQTPSKIMIQSSAINMMNDVVIQGDIEENISVTQLIKKRSALFAQPKSHQTEQDESQLLVHEKELWNDQKALMASVAENNNVFIQALALRWVSPKGDYERIPELVKSTCQKLQKTSPNHPWTAQICKKSSSLPLTVGDTFPNESLPMSNGDTVNIYSMFGSKLTLIDLWASWCAPCRHENKNTLVPLWDRFHDQGFQIIGYALDSSEKGWKNAIIKDGADRWLHASHLQGDVSPLFEKLKMTTIPANYLVDQNGMILAKNLHGEEMTQWVAEYLKK